MFIGKVIYISTYVYTLLKNLDQHYLEIVGELKWFGDYFVLHM